MVPAPGNSLGLDGGQEYDSTHCPCGGHMAPHLVQQLLVYHFLHVFPSVPSRDPWILLKASQQADLG